MRRSIKIHLLARYTRCLSVITILLLLNACQTLNQSVVDTVENPLPSATTSDKTQPEETLVAQPTSAESLSDSEIEQQNLEVVSTDVQAPQTEPQIENIWYRIAEGMQIQVPQNKRVRMQRDWYAKHQKYLDRVIDRAQPFLYLIVEEIEARNMPMELALLPIVESAFDPFAYSHGRASGMWQFIPGTAKRFGLEQNWWYDGRRDVYASTLAALDYLEYLHKHFKGNWLHALAAYNSGEGNVGRAIRNNKKRKKPTDFWNLRLPKETKAYVPKLLALSDLLKRDAEFALNWKPLPDSQAVKKVDIGSQLDLALAAELSDMTVEQIYRLNPGFNRWSTPPKGPH
ncbi:MAG: transglycosylase SLT domain-containing protein, partial [Enterobacterales bacterium]|nr:transglycosylase SLT domain-containing protein [Enterobacterales bacterium]